jgi:hypothetical protein
MPSACRDFGLKPRLFLHASPRKLEDALWLAETAVESGVFPATILEVRGNPKHFGLTESRRLNLRAKASGARFSCCGKLERKRRAAPSSASLPNPRRPRRGLCRMARCWAAASATRCFRLTLEKSRNPAPLSLLLEWNPHDRRFFPVRQSADTRFPDERAAHSGAQLPASSNRPDRQKRWGLSWRSRGRPDAPPIVCSGSSCNNAMRLTALDEAAEAMGLKKNMGVAEARAIYPTIDVIEEDPAADRRFLEGIADWCDRYTPLVALDGKDGLFLDITGCAHLFGGEKALLKDILSTAPADGTRCARRHFLISRTFLGRQPLWPGRRLSPRMKPNDLAPLPGRVAAPP